MMPLPIYIPPFAPKVKARFPATTPNKAVNIGGSHNRLPPNVNAFRQSVLQNFHHQFH